MQGAGRVSQRRLNPAIAEFEERLRTLNATLQSRLVEARLVRRTLETLVEVRRAITAQLEHPRRPHARLDLRHANRVF
jgi:hypothetical protein